MTGESFGNRMRNVWRPISQRLWLLWACRISIISAGAGLLLFAMTPQSRNLFSDLSWTATWSRETVFWLWVFMSLFFLWAFPVHYAARRALDEDDWLISRRLRERLDDEQRDRIVRESRTELKRSIEWTPRVLGYVPFIAFAFGIIGEYATLPRAEILTQVGATILQLRCLLLVDIVFFVLFAIFIVKRQKLIRMNPAKGFALDPEAIKRREIHLQWLAWICLVITAVFSLIAWLAPIVFSNFVPRAALVALVFGTPVLSWAWLARKADHYGVPFVAMVIIFFGVVIASNVHYNDIRTLTTNPGETTARQIDLDEAIARWSRSNGCASDLKSCPPALIVAADGGASRASFMTATAIGSLLDTLGANSQLPAARRIFALSGVSGGSFGVATIQAALRDAAAHHNQVPCRRAPREWFRAADFWSANKTPTTWRDCLQALVSGDYLSAVFPGLAYRDNFPLFGLIREDRAGLLEDSFERHYNFVTCLNNNGVSCPVVPALAESGSNCVAALNAEGLCRPFGYISQAQQDSDPWIPLLALNATSVQTGRRIIVSDLVATASKEGQPRQPLYPEAYDFFEVTSTPCQDPSHLACPAASVGSRDNPALRNAPDLRLSTAALTSARFPIISPAGGFEMKSDEGYGDSLVDGGYFENSGLSTAADIAVQLQRRDVRVAILTISNEPEAPKVRKTPPRAASTPTVGLSTVAAPISGFFNRLFGLLGAPISSLYNTRDGHGAEARNTALLTVNPIPQDPNKNVPNRFFKVSVYANTQSLDIKTDPACARYEEGSIEMPDVSMSWWLSAAVQADLDAQMCDPRNIRSIRDLTALLSE